MKRKNKHNNNLIQSIAHACRGVKYVFVHEQNFRIQAVVASIVVVVMLLLPLRNIERVLLLGLIMGIFILEIFNSVIEKFVDIVNPRLTYQVKVVKDMMAAAVLIVSIGTGIIGIFIFFPYIEQVLIEIFLQ
jgi:undecaprenol kinase